MPDLKNQIDPSQSQVEAIKDVAVISQAAPKPQVTDPLTMFQPSSPITDPLTLLKARPGNGIDGPGGVATSVGSAVGSIGTTGLPPFLSSPLVSYRDYLRDIWVQNDKGQTGDEQSETVTIDEAAALVELETRFRQSFRTLRTTPECLNGILCRIVRNLLLAPTGAWGLGRDATAIEAQGDRAPRAYLDYLVGSSGIGATELALRYGLDLGRSDMVVSSEVEQNIFTLQRYFSDQLQAGASVPPTHVEHWHPQRTPFYLEYEEWQRQQLPFHAENLYPFRRFFEGPIGLTPPPPPAGPLDDSRNVLTNLVRTLSGLRTTLAASSAALDIDDFETARQRYAEVLTAAGPIADRYYDTSSDGTIWSTPPSARALAERAGADLRARQALPVTTRNELDTLVSWFAIDALAPGRGDDAAAIATKTRRATDAIVFFVDVIAPVLAGDLALAVGDHLGALRAYGRVLAPGRALGVGGADQPATFLYREDSGGDLPYTFFNIVNAPEDAWPPVVAAGLLHPVEAAAIRLRFAQAALRWADALYRGGSQAECARARELYKAVFWVHGQTPPVVPSWGRPTSVAPVDDNPAVAGQILRARLALAQLDSGLNVYGYSDELVPVLRYRPLKDSADRMAAAAKSAQRDLLGYLERADDAVRAALSAANLAQRSALQVQIAADQTVIADHAITVAETQRDHVLAQIRAKQHELEDHQGLIGQFTDFVDGFKGAIESMGPLSRSATGAGEQVLGGVGSSLGSQIGEIGGQGLADARAAGAALGAAGGGNGSTAAGGAAALGAGTILGAYALFIYGSYRSLSGLVDAQNRRVGELATLRNEVLPAAEAQIDVRRRERSIAGYQQQIAAADAALARDLLAFQSTRVLDADFWRELARVVERTLTQYVDLGARAAWLAERALAYEQGRALSIIRYDYVSDVRGTSQEAADRLLGADALLADLAMLDAARLDGARALVPVRHTLSLLTEQPLALGQLKATGRCTFGTLSAALRVAYPGTFDHRLRDVSVDVVRAGAAPIRGALSNDGLSVVVGIDPLDRRVILRPADGLPISDFTPQGDQVAFGPPGERLLPFEGSGADTFWAIDLPSPANPGGLEGVVDVLLTFDIEARYSAELLAHERGAVPSTELERLWVASAASAAPAELAALRGAGETRSIRFVAASLGLPRRERERRLRHVALALAGRALPARLTATLRLAQVADPIALTFVDGVATTTIASGAPPAPSSPLDALYDVDPAQDWTVQFDRTETVDWSGLLDVVLTLDYVAHPM